MGPVVVVPLSREHDRIGFDCGDAYYNGFLQRQALQHMRQRMSVTWVAVREGNPAILGYITLSMGKVEFENVDEAILARLPKHPIPVLHVGKLAVDESAQGKRVGALLLRFAAEHAVAISKSVGCHAVELWADHESLVAYYRRYGFLLMKEGSRRMYQSVEAIERAMQAARAREDASS